jgi:hypothetical protein
MIFFLFNDAESLVWTHHDIAEILLELALNTTQSINVIVNVLVNFVNSSMRKLKTQLMTEKIYINNFDIVKKSHNVVSNTPPHERDLNSQLLWF